MQICTHTYWMECVYGITGINHIIVQRHGYGMYAFNNVLEKIVQIYMRQHECTQMQKRFITIHILNLFHHMY